MMPGSLTTQDGSKEAAPCCCGTFIHGTADSDEVDDAAFFRNVAVSVVRDVVPNETSNNVTIDTSRIYMAGHSTGCMASIAMATIHSDLVAAVCCHAGVAQVPFPISYQATPTWIVHGKADPIVKFDGGNFSFSASETHEH